MHQWIPQKSNETARNMILLLFCGAFALLALTSLFGDIPFRWAFQTVALLLLTAAIFLVTRYMTKRFTYRIEPDGEDAYDLTVIESSANGKRAVTVCRIGLHHVAKQASLIFRTEENPLRLGTASKRVEKRSMTTEWIFAPPSFYCSP